jgi:DNA-binding response OmpR family regulator
MPLNDYVLVIADDDPEILRSYAAMLKPKGFVVHTCGNGEEALSLCRQFRPAVAVLDLRMPILDGFATARRLRDDAELGSIRLIAITAFSDERSSARAWDAGFHEFLAKPVPVSMLLAIVRPTKHLQGIIDRNS